MAGQRDTAVFLNLKGDMAKILEQIQKQTKDFNKSLDQIKNNKGFSNLNNDLKKSKEGLGSVNSSISSTIKKFAAWTIAIVGIKEVTESVFSFYKKGVEANISTEKAELGLAGLITSLNVIKKDGKELTGFDAFTQSVKIAKDQVKQLTLAAMTTGASIQDVTDAMQTALAPGLANGFNIDQIREISVLMANTTKAMGMESGQTSQEIIALLSGQINSDTQVATSLGLGAGGPLQQAYKDALKAGKGYDFLIDKMKDFKTAGEATSKTLQGSIDAMGDIWNLFAGKSAEALTNELAKVGPELSKLFDTNTGDFKEGIKGAADTLDYMGGVVGSTIADGFKWIINASVEFGEYLSKNQTLLNTISMTVDAIGGFFGLIWTIIKEVFGVVVDLVKGLFDMSDETKSTTENADGLQSTLETINKVIYFITLGFQLIADTVKLIADAIRLAIGGALVIIEGLIVGLLKGVQVMMEALGSDDLAAKLGKNIDVVSKKMVGLEKSTVGANNSLVNMFKDNASLAKVYAKSITMIENGHKNGIDGSKGNKSYNEYINNKNKKITDDLIDSIIDKHQTTVTTKNDSKNESGKKKKGGEDSGKLAYDKQLKELEMFAKRQKEITENMNRNLDLDYSNHLINIKDYFKQKNELTDQDYKNQLDVINKQIEAAQKQSGNSKKTKDNNKVSEQLIELQNQKIKLEEDYAFQIKKSGLEQKKALQDYKNELDNIYATVLEMTGNNQQAQKIKVDIEINEIKDKYQSETDPVVKARIEQYVKLKEAQSEVNGVAADFNSILDVQSSKESVLSALKDAGRISDIDYFSKLKELRSGNIDQLQAEIDKLTEINNVSQSPAITAQIENLKAKMIELDSTVDPLAKKFDDLFVNGLSDSLAQFVAGTKSAKEAFSDFAANIGAELTKLAMNKVLTSLFDSLMGDTKSGGSGGTGFGALISNVFGSFAGGKASGGSVKGGSTYRINESGDEYFTPSRDGYILNASQTKNALNKNNNSNNINQYITIQANDVNSFNQSSGQISAQLGAMVRNSNRNM